MKKVTAIIPTFNEEDHIAASLKSVAWADEIIVVDSYSTDRTPEIVAQHPKVKWIQHEYQNSAAQKNWIIPQATHEWIFLLDADERVSPELLDKIMQWKNGAEEQEVAYWIARQNYFLGQKLRFIWKGDAVVRLFQRDQCRYETLNVHAEIIAQGKIGRWSEKIHHHSFLTLERYQAKMERYAHWSAKDYEKKTGNISFYHLYIKPAYRFFKHYLLELGILDGRAGWIISTFMAKGVQRRYQIILENRKNDQAT